MVCYEEAHGVSATSKGRNLLVPRAEAAVCTPPATWWIVAITLDAVAGEISIVIKRLQGLMTVLSQQKAQLQGLAEKLKSLCEVRGPHDDSTLSMIDRNYNVICGPYAVSLSNARDFIENQGSFVMGAMAALPMEDAFMMVRSVASLFCGLVNGISNVVAHRDRNNNASDEIIPATLPHSLCQLRTSALCALVRRHKMRSEVAEWDVQAIEEIENDHKAMARAYRNETAFSAAINKCCDSGTDYDHAWVVCNGRFPKLGVLAGNGLYLPQY
jgi:hypothetical protein